MLHTERLLATLQRQLTDRVPVAPIFAMSYLRKWHQPDQDFIGAQREAFTRFACDPMLLLKLDASAGGWPDARKYWCLHHWPEAPYDSWNLRERIVWQNEQGRCVSWTIETPKGCLTTEIEYDRDTNWLHEYPVKHEEDIELLCHRPDPAGLPLAQILNAQLARIQDCGLGYIYVPGVWHQACDFRGSVQLSYDVFDRPRWVHRLLGMLREYMVAVVQEMARSRLRVLMVNESYVGLGISPRIFHDFILPEDRAIVQAIHDAGLPTVFHVCGRSHALLELMADTGTDGIETLAPPATGGDTDLADAKRRVGNRVALRGGFNQHVLERGDQKEIVENVQQCLDQAAGNGGYILAPTGFLTEEVAPASIELFCESTYARSDAMASAGG